MYLAVGATLMKPVILPFFVGTNGEALSSCVLQVSPAAVHMGVLLRGDGGGGGVL